MLGTWTTTRCGVLVGVLALLGCDVASDPPDPAPEAVTLAPAPPRLRRLTQAQFHHTVRDVFGPDVIVTGPLDADARLDGLVAVGATSATVSPRGVELYEEAALSIAEQVTADPDTARLPCRPLDAFDVECTRDVLRVWGRRIWRRPLTSDELARLLDVTVRAQVVLGDAWQGLEFGLAALLQAPDFLFRVEIGEAFPAAIVDGDQRGANDRSTTYRYTNYEMASRLAYFLWNTTPDDALLDAADAGDLVDNVRLAQVVADMLRDTRARAGVRAFFADYLGLDALSTIIKDPLVFTRYTPDLGLMARTETLGTIEAMVFDEGADYRTLFTRRTTLVNRKLAALYGISAPTADGFGAVTLPDHSARVGLLGQVSVLALHSHPTASSATLRGRFIRETLLCGRIPPPPADVDTSLPEPDPTRPTLRQRVAVHLTEPSCAGCHQAMDPLGLALENFDGLGRYRDRENGTIIDASGRLDGVDFDGPVGLALAVAEHPNVPSCLTERLFAYATGHAPTAGEAETVDALTAEFVASGHRVKSLLAAIALSPAFRTVGPTPSGEEGTP